MGLHLMLNVEFNTLNDFLCFLCIDEHDLGHFGSNFPDSSQFPKYTKTGVTRLSVGLYPWVWFHFIWNVEFNTLNDFPCIHALFWGCICPNTVKQYNLTLRWPLHLISKASFSMKSWVTHLQWFSIYDSLTFIWGIRVQSPKITSMPENFYNIADPQMTLKLE